MALESSVKNEHWRHRYVWGWGVLWWVAAWGETKFLPCTLDNKLDMVGALLVTGVVNLWSHLSQKYLFMPNLTGAAHTKHCCDTVVAGPNVWGVLLATWDDDPWDPPWLFEALDLLFLEWPPPLEELWWPWPWPWPPDPWWPPALLLWWLLALDCTDAGLLAAFDPPPDVVPDVLGST